jgi:hypothetical protein
MAVCRVTKIIEKKLPNFLKVTQRVANPKMQKIKNKAKFGSPKHLHQATLDSLKYLEHPMVLNCF